MATDSRQRFTSFEQWRRVANKAQPRRPDDTPVLAGQTGPRRRATREELETLIAAQRAKHATRA